MDAKQMAQLTGLEGELVKLRIRLARQEKAAADTAGLIAFYMEQKVALESAPVKAR